MHTWRKMSFAGSVIAGLLSACMIVLAAADAPCGDKYPGKVGDMLDKMTWLGHDTFRVQAGGVVIYTDPFKLADGLPKADLVLITHEHYDHCSPEDVAKITGENTVIVAPEDCKAKLSGTVKVVKPGDSMTEKGVGITAVPSYNTNKKFHPKANGWVGYIFTVEGQSIYIAGDTDYIPEMKDYRCDIALLPVSGTYVMTAEEAVKAANDIKPKVAVPMHYGAIVGSADDAETFRKLYKGATHVFEQSAR